MSTTNRGSGTIRSDVSVLPAWRCRPFATVTDDVARDGHNRNGAQFIAVDDRHAFEVEVALPNGKNLTDTNACAEHERHEVR